MRKIKYTFLCLIVIVCSTITLADPSAIPVKDFFKNPDFSSMQLSPNGKFMATMAPINDRRNIVVFETEGLKNPRPLTGLKNQDIASFFWANNDEIVFTMDSDGDEAFGIYKIGLKKKSRIIMLVGASVSMGGRGIRSASVVHTLPDEDDYIIVQFNGRRINSPDLYRLNLNSSWRSSKSNPGMKIIAKNPGDVQNWIVDNQGRVRGAFSLSGRHGEFHYKDVGEEDFRAIRKFDVLEESITPLGFDFDDKMMIVASNIGRDKNAIYRFDPNKNKLGEMLYGNDAVDVTGLIASRKQQKILGVSYFDDYPHSVIFDEEEKARRKQLSDAFPNKVVSISSTNREETLSILTVSSDTDVGSYYLYDRVSGQVKFLASRMHWLKEELMSPMKPVHFKSRDGLDIQGYLTVPKLSKKGEKLPLIVNPHGGPFGVRDYWGFNPEHQFFASRGYAVVQVNYRGSGGFGREFEHAGYGAKWGAEMQNDLTDAVKYLVKEGIVDENRVCIYGGSYGGYATMAGLTFTPELYQCGINYVGVTDVGLLFSSMPSHWEPAKELLKIQIGDPENKELMNRMSPIAHVDKIKAPVMIIHGRKDPRVVFKHAEMLREKLDDLKKPYKWLVKNNEGHGFRKEENRIEAYVEMEKFLKEHLKK